MHITVDQYGTFFVPRANPALRAPQCVATAASVQGRSSSSQVTMMKQSASGQFRALWQPVPNCLSPIEASVQSSGSSGVAVVKGTLVSSRGLPGTGWYDRSDRGGPAGCRGVGVGVADGCEFLTGTLRTG